MSYSCFFILKMKNMHPVLSYSAQKLIDNDSLSHHLCANLEALMQTSSICSHLNPIM